MFGILREPEIVDRKAVERTSDTFGSQRNGVLASALTAVESSMVGLSRFLGLKASADLRERLLLSEGVRVNPCVFEVGDTT